MGSLADDGMLDTPCPSQDDEVGNFETQRIKDDGNSQLSQYISVWAVLAVFVWQSSYGSPRMAVLVGSSRIRLFFFDLVA